MPENDHAITRRTLDDAFTRNAASDFVELGVTTCFSFLRGASDAIDLASAANDLGYHALGCADLNTMAGVVRLHAAALAARIDSVPRNERT